MPETESFPIKQGDTLPYLDAQLLEGVAVVDLTGASVNFVLRGCGCNADLMRKLAALRSRDPETTYELKSVACGCGAPVLFSKPAQIRDVAGLVRYQWEKGDTDIPGYMQGEFEISYGESRVITHPTKGFIPITINADLG